MTSVVVMSISFADLLSFLISIIPLNSSPVPKLFRLPKAHSNILKMLQTFSVPPKKEKNFKNLIIKKPEKN